MKNKKIIVGLVLILLIVVASASSFVLFKSKGSKNKEQTNVEETTGENLKQIKAEDIGLSLTLSPDKKSVTMEISKLSGILSIEYEVDYTAEVIEEGEKINVPRGVVNSPIEVKPGESKIQREILMGTCSKKVCKYDNIVSDIRFVIKVSYKNGEIGSLEDKVALEK